LGKVIKDRDARIGELETIIRRLNERISSNNAKAHSQTFTMDEVARFKSGR
jgi:hypothetical protein